MRSEKIHWTDFRTGVQLPSSPQKDPDVHAHRIFIYIKESCRIFLQDVCGRRDLNPYPLPDTPLKRARMPIPPRPHADEQMNYNSRDLLCQDRFRMSVSGPQRQRLMICPLTKYSFADNLHMNLVFGDDYNTVQVFIRSGGNSAVYLYAVCILCFRRVR